MAKEKGCGKIAAKAEEIIRGPVEKAGYLLWDVEYYKEGADFNLRVTIENPDRQTPIDLDDCEKVSRLLSPILDETDPIEEAYYLEVSSAGLSRTLNRPEHFDFYSGKPVSLRLYAPVEGKKEFSGNLVSRSAEEIVIEIEGEEFKFQNEAVAKVVTAEEL